MQKSVAPVTLAILLAGCTVGPDYTQPKVETPASFAEPTPVNASADSVDLAHWWTAFGDPELDRLVDTALDQGLDIKAAASRIRQARYAEATARSRFLPQINASGGVNRVDFSKNAGFASLASLFSGSGGGGGGAGSSGGVALPGGGITTYSAGFDASWEIDLFGAGTRSAEAAAARVGAAEWNARDAAVSLAAEVANSYLQLRTLQKREAVLREEAARQQRLSLLQSHRAQVGLTPETDSIRQRASLSATEAAIEPVIVQERIQMHAIAVLLGKQPGALIDQLSQPTNATDTPPPVPPGLPSDLLRRRPDVRAAERRLAAATGDVGVAVADLYPHFSLTGVAELISSSLASLFESDSLQTTAGAKAIFPVLDFGRRRGQVDIRQEDRQQAYIAYQKTVLGALKDVEDALVRVQGEQNRNKRLQASVSDAERGLKAVRAKYDTGLVDLSAVLQAQASVLDARNQLAESDGALKQALASLYKALGGGWDEATIKGIEATQPTPLDASQQQP
ncbi:efflux transporter outer membrane subunit [Stakelama marina]|uniref:Efflux transporter outer membrane subunit n=1 Tax=Stakelama marina TaxID=2826939 RepID=A0A8T4ICW6_9SPHN|nr:efflux transporter outer membrane subunit [Stakelama marina]MBR0551694.1 efflux transporter outer membrane subunit [Stakelama marina]